MSKGDLTSSAEVVGHVSEDIGNAGALGAEDALLVLGGHSNLHVQQLVALRLGQAAAIVHLVEVAANRVHFLSSTRSVQVEAIADSLRGTNTAIEGGERKPRKSSKENHDKEGRRNQKLCGEEAA